jgi:predicted O-methyltransferase YrrM
MRAAPGLRRLYDLLLERDQSRRTIAEWARFVPPGHFYSPVPDLGEVRERAHLLFAREAGVPGISLNAEHQLDQLRSFAFFGADLPWQATRQPGLRYYYENDFFSYGDAAILHGVMRLYRPRRIVEIGSGFSSCAMLDTSERFLDGAVALTFVEPHPERLFGLLEGSDVERVDVRRCRLQDLPLSDLSALGENDILFIDSSHVSKVGSDVNWLFFHVLPRLTSGVLVQLHDVFYPFEYPMEWILEGRAWNEAYLLRAFLMYNETVRIEYWNDFIATFHREELAARLSVCLHNTGGSIWLRRL